MTFYNFNLIVSLTDHIDHIVDTAGVDHVGIGGDLSGIEA